MIDDCMSITLLMDENEILSDAALIYAMAYSIKTCSKDKPG
jgi:hypothetical protein